MSKNLRHAIYHYWLWRRDHILGCCLVIILCSLYYHFFPFRNLLIDGGLILFSVVLPFTLFTKDIFSWKYYQSLPLSKRELYHYHLLIQYLIYLPFLVWYFSFSDVFNDFLFSSPEVSLRSMAIAAGVYIFGAAFVGMTSFYKGFEELRQPYVKRSGYYHTLQLSRNCLYSVAGIFLAWLILQKVGVFLPLTNVIIGVSIIVAGVLAMPLGFVWYYWFVFERWNKEELSYFKKNFRPLRDLPLMGISLLFITIFFQTIGGSETALYGNEGVSELHRAIHKKDRQTFYRLLSDKKLIQAKTNTGWTALMVAAHDGNYEFYQALIAAGASQIGRINAPKDKFHHNMDLFLLAIDGKNDSIVSELMTEERARSGAGEFSALYLATYHCSLKNIDLLLEKGADPNARNIHEETPLHVAARKGCFGGAIALIDSGADPLRKDKKGKTALDYAKNSNVQFAYYLMKKGRIPAGK